MSATWKELLIVFKTFPMWETWEFLETGLFYDKIFQKQFT
jgi:hypothetical protein